MSAGPITPSGRAPSHTGGDVRPIAPTLEELVGGEVRREAMRVDGKSGAHLERIEVDGQRYVVKHLHPADDWLMRATGDHDLRALALWRHGWLDRLPDAIDHAIVGAARQRRPDGDAGVLVMRDVGPALLPDGDEEIPLEQHLRFIDHMARLHVAFWGQRDTIGLLPLTERFVWFGPRLADRERANGGTNPVPTRFVPEGWERFPARAPRVAGLVGDLLDDPTPLVTALTATPQTLVHGDFKAANLGSHPDGRTVLLDWDLPGIAPPCADIAWYVCLNRARLPQSKEDTLLAHRDALERHGIDTRSWWPRQSALCLLGTLLLFGWEKALGEGQDAAAELAWWEDRALEARQHL